MSMVSMELLSHTRDKALTMPKNITNYHFISKNVSKIKKAHHNPLK